MFYSKKIAWWGYFFFYCGYFNLSSWLPEPRSFTVNGQTCLKWEVFLYYIIILGLWQRMWYPLPICILFQTKQQWHEMPQQNWSEWHVARRLFLRQTPMILVLLAPELFVLWFLLSAVASMGLCLWLVRLPFSSVSSFVIIVIFISVCTSVWAGLAD